MSALHVCYIVKRFPRLSQTFVLNELLALQRQGVALTVVALRHSEETHARYAELTAPVYYLADLASTPPIDVAGEAALITALVIKRGITHLHAHFATRAATIACLVSANTGVPFSFTAHAHDIFHAEVDRSALACTIAAARFVITVSEYNRCYLSDLLQTEHRVGRVIRLYNGVDLTRLKPTDSQSTDLIVGVGRLIAKKGFADLVDAIGYLRVMGRAVRCLIVGEGEERMTIQRRIAANNLEDAVWLLGAQPPEETIRIIGSAAVFALPCMIGADGDRDGMPTVLVEAMALGTPVVSTNVAGISELVEHERTGLLAVEHDPLSLAFMIARMLDEGELRERLRLAALQHVHANFDLDRNVTRLKHCFRSATEDIWD